MFAENMVAYFFGALRRGRGKFVNGACEGASLGRHVGLCERETLILISEDQFEIVNALGRLENLGDERWRLGCMT